MKFAKSRLESAGVRARFPNCSFLFYCRLGRWGKGRGRKSERMKKEGEYSHILFYECAGEVITKLAYTYMARAVFTYKKGYKMKKKIFSTLRAHEQEKNKEGGRRRRERWRWKRWKWKEWERKQRRTSEYF